MKLYFEIGRLVESRGIEYAADKYERDYRVIECISDYSNKVILRKKLTRTTGGHVDPPIIEKEIYSRLDKGERAHFIGDDYFINRELVMRFANKYVKRENAPVDPIEAEKIAALFDKAMEHSDAAMFKRNIKKSKKFSRGDVVYLKDFEHNVYDEPTFTPATVLDVIQDTVPMVRVSLKGFFGELETIVLASQLATPKNG